LFVSATILVNKVEYISSASFSRKRNCVWNMHAQMKRHCFLRIYVDIKPEAII